MRLGRTAVLGAGLIVAGLVGAITLLLTGESTVVASVRLDDHETSWPDHVPVQLDGVAQLDDALTELGVADVEVNAREDRSTIEVRADEAVPGDAVDAAVAAVVIGDRNRPLDPTLEAGLREAEATVAQVVRSGGSPDDVRGLASTAVERRADLADATFATATERSRFVSMGPASEDGEGSAIVQWAAAAALVLVGAAIVVRPRGAQ